MFHPITLAPTFLLAVFYYGVTDRPGRFALFAILAVSEEEMALLVFMMGVYLLLIIRRRPRWGVITMVAAYGAGLCWRCWASNNFLPTATFTGGRYGYLGDSPGQMVLSLLTRLPRSRVGTASGGRCRGYLWALLWPTALLALFAPEVLVLALPSLAINLLADFPPMHETHTLIGCLPIAPLVLAAAVMGLARLLGAGGASALAWPKC